LITQTTLETQLLLRGVCTNKVLRTLAACCNWWNGKPHLSEWN